MRFKIVKLIISLMLFPLGCLAQNIFPTNQGGHVGIGTLSPQSPLTIKSTNDAITTYQTTDNTWLYTNWLDKDNNRRLYMGLSADLSSFNIATFNGTNKLILTGSNVGIGVTPEEVFQIRNAFVFHSGGHEVLGFQFKPSGGVDLSPSKYAGEVRFDPANGDLRLGTSSTITSTPLTRLSISKDGKVGIGTFDTGSHRLAIEGSIGAREVKVEVGTWSDFVFKKDYDLPDLETVEKHIQEKGHLEGIPSEEEVKEDGVFLGEMDAKLLQKIEELMLYTIEQQKLIHVLNEKVKILEDDLKSLKTKN
ncbi:hypothetical protein HX109_10960 [Galbibacter sp. BG1]|uniref:hypothetical protein n=1 Tax=Galbibacter sp. BG1 TaxID=1170699 RepID=UPI0015BE6C18|nr:hypothetical protein [Galbibacter sp. BG1]QLE02048.1 hypothetical protein HX109_10960 [Galbibacter sp. BG1]